MTKRLTNLFAAVCLILSCMIVSLNVGCGSGEPDNTATPSSEDVSKDKTDPKDGNTGDVAPTIPDEPGT